MGQPDIQQTFSAVSVEGFEQIYQPQLEAAQPAPDHVQNDPAIEAQTGPAHQTQPDPSHGVALEEAAKALGLHIDTVRKRLQKGKIKGFKVADKFGDKWLVHKDELSKVRTIQAEPPQQAQPAPDLIQPHPMEQAQPDPSQDQDDPVVEVEIAPDLSTPQNDVEYARLMSIIESQAHQLKAAGDVIMYLRSEVEDAKAQVKLLTDSQKKTSFWSRFLAFIR